jgi:hypothetical protein
MTNAIELRIDGPYSDDSTIEVVWAIAEATRVINHATRSEAGLSRPQTADAVVTALSLTATRLEQTARQLAAFLAHQYDGGSITMTPASAVDDAVSDAVVFLGHARDAAAQLKRALHNAHTATAGLAHRPAPRYRAQAVR